MAGFTEPAAALQRYPSAYDVRVLSYISPWLRRFTRTGLDKYLNNVYSGRIYAKAYELLTDENGLSLYVVRLMDTKSSVSGSCLLQAIRNISYDNIVISPPENDSFRKDLCFTHDVFFIYFATRDLRDAWVDRREILHGGQY